MGAKAVTKGDTKTALLEAGMDIMRDKAIENMKLMEPDQAMKMWMPFMNQGMNQGMDFFKNIMTGVATSAGTGKSKKSDK